MKKFVLDLPNYRNHWLCLIGSEMTYNLPIKNTLFAPPEPGMNIPATIYWVKNHAMRIWFEVGSPITLNTKYQTVKGLLTAAYPDGPYPRNTVLKIRTDEVINKSIPDLEKITGTQYLALRAIKSHRGNINLVHGKTVQELYKKNLLNNFTDTQNGVTDEAVRAMEAFEKKPKNAWILELAEVRYNDEIA